MAAVHTPQSPGQVRQSSPAWPSHVLLPQLPLATLAPQTTSKFTQQLPASMQPASHWHDHASLCTQPSAVQLWTAGGRQEFLPT